MRWDIGSVVEAGENKLLTNVKAPLTFSAVFSATGEHHSEQRQNFTDEKHNI